MNLAFHGTGGEARDKASLSRGEGISMRAITAYELTHVDTPVDRSGLQFKRTWLKQ